MRKNQPSAQALLSTLVASLFFALAIMLLGKQHSSWNQSANEDHKIWTFFAPLFTAALTVSGWIYVLIGKRLFGITHALLMVGAAGMGFYFGVLPLILHDYPVESLAALPLMAYGAIGIVALVCAIGMILDLRRAKPRENDNGKQE